MGQAYETCHNRHDDLKMHRHTSAYLSLVLEGSYEELSVDGRYEVSPGTLVYHPPYHAHQNTFLGDDIRVLNIDLHNQNLGKGYRCLRASCDAPVLERLIRDKPQEAPFALAEIMDARALTPEPTPPWLKKLARALSMEDNPEPISCLARHLGVTPEHVTRKFQREFGVGPASFRTEHRLRKAIMALANGLSLAHAAAAAGFADQSHMGRTFKKALGQTPGQLIATRSNSF